jgi:hypothetical protein
MWRVFLAFGAHRVLLLIVALLSLNFSAPRPNSLAHSSVFLSWHELWGGILKKTEETAESESLAKALSQTTLDTVKSDPNPYIWTLRAAHEVLPFSQPILLILFGNLFFLWFLAELFGLLNRLITPDVAEVATIMAAVWVTTYELSLGASYSVPSLCAIAAVKHALDNRWLIVGFFAALLTSFGAIALPILVLLAVIFVYFQRHFFAGQIAKRVLFFLVPVGLMFWLRAGDIWSMAGGNVDSALMQFFLATRGKFPLSTFVSMNYLPQTLAVIFFAVGLVTSVPGNLIWIHRIIPFFFFLGWISYGSFGSLASRAIWVGVCFQGIASVSSPFVAKLIQVAMVVIGLYDCFRLFSAA